MPGVHHPLKVDAYAHARDAHGVHAPRVLGPLHNAPLATLECDSALLPPQPSAHCLTDNKPTPRAHWLAYLPPPSTHTLTLFPCPSTTSPSTTFSVLRRNQL